MNSGLRLRQRDGVRFADIDLHGIEELWLDGLEHLRIHRRQCQNFREFVQFESAVLTPSGAKKTGEFIGWTDGSTEFLVGIGTERHNFHPDSRIGRQ